MTIETQAQMTPALQQGQATEGDEPAGGHQTDLNADDGTTVLPAEEQMSIEELFNYDPIKAFQEQEESGRQQQQAAVEGEVEPPPAAQQQQDDEPPAAGQEQQPAQQPEAQQPPAVPGTQQSEQQPSTASPEMELLRQTVQQQQAMIQQLQQGQGQQQGGQPQGGQQQPPAEEVPNFAFQITPELQRMLDSEQGSERMQALQTFGEQMLNLGYTRMLPQIQKLVEDRVGQVRQVVKQDLEFQEERKRVFDDFYTNYQMFNKPEFHPIVQQVAAQVAKETGAQQWTDTLRDAVGARMTALFGQGMQQQQQTTPPAAPPAMGQGGRGTGQSRVVPPKADPSDEILDILSS